MALIYNGNIRNLYLGAGIREAFASQFAVTVYSGIQPTAAQVAANWSLYNSGTSNFLAHFTNLSLTQPLNGLLLQLNGMSTNPATPLNSGTATWAIMWTTNPAQSSMGTTTLPTSAFLVVPVSDAVGQGVIRFLSPSLVSGVSVNIQDGSLGSYLTA